MISYMILHENHEIVMTMQVPVWLVVSTFLSLIMFDYYIFALTLHCSGSPCQTVHGGEISNRLASSGVYVCLNMGDPHAPCARVCVLRL